MAIAMTQNKPNLADMLQFRGYQQDLNDKDRREILDNFPHHTASSYRKNGSKYYYFLDEPLPYDLYKLSRFTEIGNRIVWGFAKDVWANGFGLHFENITPEEAKIKNEVLRKHLLNVNFWEEGFRWSGFDREQGESILVVHRKGQTLKDLEVPVNPRLPVNCVEAVNKMDYDILNIGDHGRPTGYRVNFFEEGKGKPSYMVHPSHILRLRSLPLEYDLYTSHSTLKACYTTINIIETIVKSAGDSANRWGLGKPTLFAENIKNKKDAEAIMSIIGNPTESDWLLLPKNFISDVKMLGLDGANMNLLQLFELCINLIVFYTKMPKSMLIGDAVGVIEGSRVFERAYYAVLTEYQSCLVPYLERYFESDPEIKRIIGDLRYRIDFGLRQAVSDSDALQIKALRIANARAMIDFATWDEVRIEGTLSTWANSWKGTPELHMQLFGCEVKDLGGMPAKIVMNIMDAIGMTSQATETPEQEYERKNPDETPHNDDPDRKDMDETPDNEKTEETIKKIREAIYGSKNVLSLKDLANTLGVVRQTASNIRQNIERSLKV